MTLEDLEKCKCGAEAQTHIYPEDNYAEFPNGLSYYVDCININCPRVPMEEPHFRTKEAAIADWNTRQREGA